MITDLLYFRICVYAYIHIGTVIFAFVFTLIFILGLCCLQLHFRLWSYSNNVFICVYAYDHIVTVLSAFIFKLIIKDWCYYQNFIIRLWSNDTCIFSIFFACGHKKLYCLHLCIRLWSHRNSIVYIWFVSCDHIKTVLSTFVFTLIIS